MTTSLLDRLDDAVNPIVVKELRQAVRSRLVTSALLLFLLIQMIVLGIFLLTRPLDNPDDLDARAGQGIFLALQGILVGTCMVLIPAYAGFRLGSERSDTNVDLLFISTLKPRTIIWGKFVAAAVLALLIFSACAPFMTFTYLLRGVDMLTIVLVLGMDLLAVLGSTMLMLFLGSIIGNRALKAFLGLCSLGLLSWIFFGAMGFSTMMVQEGAIARARPEEFWAVLGALVIAILATMGLFFVWSVALVSPPSANRALRVRLYKVFLWALLGGMLGGISYYLKTPLPLYTWMGAMTGLFCLQAMVSINERERWGPRVAHTIPRRPLSRLAAFLFYSGSAGGVLYGMLLFVLTLVLGLAGVLVWEDRWPVYERGDPAHVARVLCVIALYTYCFALSAVLLRRMLLGEKLKGPFTWILALVLVSIGSALPYAGMLLFADQPNVFEYTHPWVALPNPFVSIFQTIYPPHSGPGTDFGDLCLVFTAGWAVVVTLLSYPWYARQLRAFRPLDRRAMRDREPAPRPIPVLEPAPLANGAPEDGGRVELSGESPG